MPVIPFTAQVHGMTVRGMLEIPPHGEDAVASECSVTIDDPHDFAEWLEDDAGDGGAAVPSGFGD